MVSEQSESNQWYVYIVECEDKSLYTGMTGNLERRFQEHSTKKSGWYTSYKAVLRLVYSEEFARKSDAAKREKQIKGWTRAKKLALSKGDSVLLKKL